jgi:hypothetical protein
VYWFWNTTPNQARSRLRVFQPRLLTAGWAPRQPLQCHRGKPYPWPRKARPPAPQDLSHLQANVCDGLFRVGTKQLPKRFAKGAYTPTLRPITLYQLSNGWRAASIMNAIDSTLCREGIITGVEGHLIRYISVIRIQAVLCSRDRVAHYSCSEVILKTLRR